MDIRAPLPAVPAAATGPADPAARAQEAAVEFEAVFLSQMLRGLGGGLGGPGPFAQEPFGSFLADEYARLIARSGGIGIAAATQRELMRLQEVAS